jgi:antitoxin Phd
MSVLPVSSARSNLAAVIESATEGPVFLERHGRRVAVVVSVDRYEELMDAAEELEDVEAFDEALEENEPTIPWEQVKVDLGWV